MFYNNPPEYFTPSMDVVICYCIYKDKFLLLRRQKGKAQEKTWTAPGGKKEKEETSQESICREVFEETGLVIHEKQLIDLGLYYVKIFDFCYTLQIFKTKLDFLPKKIILSFSEHDAYKWVTKKEALSLPLIEEGDKCILIAFPN
jgi:8-oxo-dGTP diphosphatase